MIDVQLDARLGGLAALVGQARWVADIGADHGRLALALLQQNSERQVLISDISEASLDKARRLFQGNPEQRRAIFVVADGLDALDALPEGVAEAVVIAGMGAEVIQGILHRGENKIGGAALCLQPNRDIHFLRAWLQDHGFALEEERLARAAGRYYPLLKARRGERTRYSEKELFLGPLLLAERSSLLTGYLSWRREVLRYSLRGLRQSGLASAGRKAEETERQLRWVEEELA